VEQLKDASLEEALALPAYIGLGWKSLPGTNALVYYEHGAIKMFIILTSGPSVGEESG
jgi:hypothetical protein